MPSGGPPPPGLAALWLALVLLLASPLVLLSWLVGQALLRATGWRPWKVAAGAAAAIVAVVMLAGGPEQALVLHFAGYLALLDQVGKPVVHAPLPGQFLIPQLPLSIPAGLLAAALNLMGRPRPAIDPTEVRRTQRAATRRMTLAGQRAAHVRDDHWDTPALGAAIDGDLGWADRHGLIVVPATVQARSRLLIGTSGMGKSVDIEREAFCAARAGRKFFLVDGKGTDPSSSSGPWPATCGATRTPASRSGRSWPWTAGGAPRRAAQPADGDAGLVRALLIWNGLSRRRFCLVDGMVLGSRQVARARVIGGEVAVGACCGRWGSSGSWGGTTRRDGVDRLAATLLFADWDRTSARRRKVPLTSFASARPWHPAPRGSALQRRRPDVS